MLAHHCHTADCLRPNKTPPLTGEPIAITFACMDYQRDLHEGLRQCARRVDPDYLLSSDLHCRRAFHSARRDSHSTKTQPTWPAGKRAYITARPLCASAFSIFSHNRRCKALTVGYTCRCKAYRAS